MSLMPINHSSNILNEPDSQFQILESVPNVIQQGVPRQRNEFDHLQSIVHNTISSDHSRFAASRPHRSPASASSLGPDANQPDTSTIANAAAIEDADQAVDAPDPVTSSLPELPQTTAIPILPHASTSTSTSTNASTSTSTGPHSTSFPFDQATVKAMNEKKYHYKTKMRPGISITAR